jgi:cell division protein FtsW
MIRYASIGLILCVGMLVALGLTMLASTSAWVPGVDDPYLFLRKQSIMLVIGIFAALAGAYVPLAWLRKLSPWILLSAVVALALCFVPGIGVEIYSSKRWINIPFIGQVQPSEFAKIAMMIALAAWFAQRQTHIHTFWQGFVIPALTAGVPIILILAETDAGTAMALSVTTGALMFCVGTRLIYLIPSAIMGITGAILFLYHNENRWARIQAWLNLDDPDLMLGINMQHIRALYALGNGGPTGVGLGNGVEKFGTLTLAHSDFILPAIGEELGLVSTLGIVVLFVLITLCGAAIALQANNLFTRCLALGLTCVLVIPGIMHIGVTTAMLPNDGIPLPFVSYGGTNLVFSLAAVGLLLGIHRSSRATVTSEFPLGAQVRYTVRL